MSAQCAHWVAGSNDSAVFKKDDGVTCPYCEIERLQSRLALETAALEQACNSWGKPPLSAKLREIAGDLADIAANPPMEMDSRALARLSSQLLAIAGQVSLGESIDLARTEGV